MLPSLIYKNFILCATEFNICTYKHFIQRGFLNTRFHALCYIGAMPQLVQIETFFGGGSLIVLCVTKLILAINSEVIFDTSNSLFLTI